VFYIYFNDGTKVQLKAESRHDARDWIVAIQKQLLVQPENRHGNNAIAGIGMPVSVQNEGVGAGDKDEGDEDEEKDEDEDEDREEGKGVFNKLDSEGPGHGLGGEGGQPQRKDGHGIEHSIAEGTDRELNQLEQNEWLMRGYFDEHPQLQESYQGAVLNGQTDVVDMYQAQAQVWAREQEYWQQHATHDQEEPQWLQQPGNHRDLSLIKEEELGPGVDMEIEMEQGEHEITGQLERRQQEQEQQQGLESKQQEQQEQGQQQQELEQQELEQQRIHNNLLELERQQQEQQEKVEEFMSKSMSAELEHQLESHAHVGWLWWYRPTTNHGGVNRLAVVEYSSAPAPPSILPPPTSSSSSPVNFMGKSLSNVLQISSSADKGTADGAEKKSPARPALTKHQSAREVREKERRVRETREAELRLQQELMKASGDFSASSEAAAAIVLGLDNRQVASGDDVGGGADGQRPTLAVPTLLTEAMQYQDQDLAPLQEALERETKVMDVEAKEKMEKDADRREREGAEKKRRMEEQQLAKNMVIQEVSKKHDQRKQKQWLKQTTRLLGEGDGDSGADSGADSGGDSGRVQSSPAVAVAAVAAGSPVAAPSLSKPRLDTPSTLAARYMKRRYQRRWCVLRGTQLHMHRNVDDVQRGMINMGTVAAVQVRVCSPEFPPACPHLYQPLIHL
jgi:hypothetical protein